MSGLVTGVVGGVSSGVSVTGCSDGAVGEGAAVFEPPGVSEIPPSVGSPLAEVDGEDEDEGEPDMTGLLDADTSSWSAFSIVGKSAYPGFWTGGLFDRVGEGFSL